MAKNKPIEYHRITSRHKESPERILSEAKKILEGNKDKEIRFMLTDQKGDSVNETIRKSGYTYRINKASKYDAKNLTRGAKLRTQAELKGGVKYHRLGEGGKVKSGYDKHWSDRYKHLQDTNPTNTYDKKTGKQIGQATADLRNPKNIIMDEIDDELDPVKRQAGVDFIENKISSWESKQKANRPIKKSIPFRQTKRKGRKKVFKYTEQPEVYSWLNKSQQDRFDEIKGINVSKPSEGKVYRTELGVEDADHQFVEDFDQGSRVQREIRKPKGLADKGTLLTPKYENVEATKTLKVRGYHKGNKGAVEFEKPLKVRYPKKTSPNQNVKGNEVNSSWTQVEESAKKHGVPSSVTDVDKNMSAEMDEIEKMGKSRKWSRKFFFGSPILAGIISALFAKKDLQAKGIKKPSTKQYAHQTTSSFIGFPRIMGGVGEKKGYLQNVGLTKKGVSGKRRPNVPIKGAGGKNTPFAKFMNWRKANQAIAKQIKY